MREAIRHIAIALALACSAGLAQAEEVIISPSSSDVPPKGRLFLVQSVSQQHDWAEGVGVGYLWIIRGQEPEINLGSIGFLATTQTYSLTGRHDKGFIGALEADYNLYPTFNSAQLDFSNLFGFIDVEELEKPSTAGRDGYFWAPGFKLSTGMYDDDDYGLYISMGMYYMIHHDNRSMYYTYSIGMLF